MQVEPEVGVTADAVVSVDVLLGEPDVQLKSAELTDSRLSVSWQNNTSSVFPLLMLRDCCTCKLCFSPTVNSRLTLFEQLLGTNCQASQCSVQENKVMLEWLDGHKSSYSAAWLYRRKLEPEPQEERLRKIYTDVIDTAWSSKDPGQIIKKRHYNQIIDNPEGVIELTECLIRDGVYLIEGAPDRDCLVEFLARIGATHTSTHYGANEWAVKNNPDSKDLPNSSKKLELHIDMPYMTKPCQLQLLHCLVQSKDGGENKLSDALKAAQILKAENPEQYKLLSTIEVDFQFIKCKEGKEWFICNRAPVIQEDPKTGLPTLCRFAAEVRCSTFNQPIEIVEAWFEAFRNYWKILEDNAIFLKSKPGDILAFNNGRVMHAREPFNMQQARKLEGIYAEWDYLLSAWRMAKVKLEQAKKVD